MQQCSSLLEVINYIIELYFPKATAHAARLFKHVDVDGDGELNEKEFLEVPLSWIYVLQQVFIKNQSLFASGMSKGFRADGEARGDSQPMYD